MMLSENSSKARNVLILLYVLAIYILFQLCWWGFHLVQLNQQILELKSEISGESQMYLLKSKIWMVAGEGGVFIFLLAVGFWYILRTFRREIRLARMEKTFLLSVTHELKTPIAAVKLQLETLNSTELNSNQRDRLMQNALRETRRLQDLTENILLATRLGQQGLQPQLELISLHKLVNREAERFRTFFNAQIELDGDSEILIEGDSIMITSVFANLIENALKYGNNQLVKISFRQQHTDVVVEVADLGPGITDVEKERVFDKFYRSGNEETRSSQGTGLGLYICDTVVKMHQGKIFIRNNQPNGSIFVVVFPRKQIQ